MLRKWIFAVLLSGISVTTLADELTPFGNVSRLLNYEGHSGPLIRIADNTAMSITSGFCTRNDYYILPLNHKYFDQNYAMLLAAKFSGKTVYVSLATDDCVDGLPRIKHIRVDD